MEGVLDVERQVEVADIYPLHALVEGVEDVELHVVEGLEERLDELALEGEQLGQLLLKEVVEVVELLGRRLHFVLGLPHGLFVLGRLAKKHDDVIKKPNFPWGHPTWFL